MRIAIVNTSLRHGGAEHFTVTMANALSANKENTVFLITSGVKENEYPLLKNVFRKTFLCEKAGVLELLKDTFSIQSFVKKNHIDVVVGIGIYPNLCVCLSKFLMPKQKVVISERNSPKHDFLAWQSKLLRFLLFRFADGYVFQTQQAKSYYSKKIQSKGCVIHNPVADDLPVKSQQEKQEIVAVGRLSPQKDYKTMLRAFAKVHQMHPEYLLRIFGQGKEESSLKALAKELGIETQVVFEGFSLDVHQSIKDSSIYVMSSLFEGMPNALMEAMAMGFPVVSTDCPSGGPEELIQDGANGLLVPVQDWEKMAEKICFLIENPMQRQQMGQKASLMRQTHSTQNILKKWESFLAAVVNP